MLVRWLWEQQKLTVIYFREICKSPRVLVSPKFEALLWHNFSPFFQQWRTSMQSELKLIVKPLSYCYFSQTFHRFPETICWFVFEFTHWAKAKGISFKENSSCSNTIAAAPPRPLSLTSILGTWKGDLCEGHCGEFNTNGEFEQRGGTSRSGKTQHLTPRTRGEALLHH